MVRIEKVMNEHDLKDFISFPSTLYKHDPNWIAPLFVERAEHLSKKIQVLNTLNGKHGWPKKMR